MFITLLLAIASIHCTSTNIVITLTSLVTVGNPSYARASSAVVTMITMSFSAVLVITSIPTILDLAAITGPQAVKSPKQAAPEIYTTLIPMPQIP